MSRAHTLLAILAINPFVVVSNAAKPPVGRGHCGPVWRTDWRKTA
jgi:hypothetical protein